MRRDETRVTLRDVTGADLPTLLVLNDGAAPHVNVLDAPRLARIVASARIATVAEVDGSVAGFVVALGPGVSYESENYRWFSRFSDSFLYVDRVVVRATMRRLGLGRRLYDVVETAARASGAEIVGCEVNVRPPNPESLRFHLSLGFAEVGRQDTEGGAKSVVLLAKDLRPRQE